MAKKIVILSGPSCVGKGPLRAALKRNHPEIKFAEPVLLHSRAPRRKKANGEFEVHGVDYYFLPRGLFDQLDPNRFLVVKIRTEYQAIDLVQLKYLLEEHDLVLVEAYTTLAEKLINWTRKKSGVDIVLRNIFLTPLSDEEINELSLKQKVSPEELIYRVMKEKLLHRGEDPPEKIEARARWAFWEIQQARDYTDIIVNHAGEDDITQWSDPLGSEAQRVLDQFVKIIKSE